MKPFTLTTLLLLCIQSIVAFPGASNYDHRRYLSHAPVADIELCSRTITFATGDKFLYCSNRDVSTPNSEIKRAVIGIGGAGGDAKLMYEERMMLYLPPSMSDTTTVISLQFLQNDNKEDDTVLDIHGLGPEYLYWGGWYRYCKNAKNRGRMSSCEVIDWLVEELIEKNENLEHIAVIGHSAGGILVNRYSLLSDSEERAQAHGVTMSYGAGSAGRFVWLTTDRPGTIGINCTDTFNDWPYGLDHRVENLVPYQSSVNEVTIRYRAMTRSIYYWTGENDLLVPDPEEHCPIRAQGDTTLEIMWNYLAHIQDVCEPSYGSDCNSMFFSGPDAFMELPGQAHASSQTFSTEYVHNVMFHWPPDEDDVCSGFFGFIWCWILRLVCALPFMRFLLPICN